MPDEPEEPSAPEVPDEPELPDVPDDPDEPEVPELPDEPEVAAASFVFTNPSESITNTVFSLGASARVAEIIKPFFILNSFAIV